MNKLYGALFGFSWFLMGCDPSASDEYARIKHDQFQIASRSFVSVDKSGPRITLLGAIHIGEGGYLLDSGDPKM